jgi:excinuclease ABC subunit A
MDKPDVDFIEGCRRRSRSTRSRRAATRGRRSARSPRSTTTCACSTPASASPLPERGTRPIARQTPQQIVDRILELPRAPASRCSPRSCGAARASTRRCSRTWPAGLRPGPHRRRGATSSPKRDRSSTATRAHHRGGRRPAGAAEGIERGSPTRSRRRCARRRGRRDRDRPRRRGRRPTETLTFSSTSPAPLRHSASTSSQPRNFSFNSPYGACETCSGLGTRFEVDPELVVPDPDLSLDEGAIAPWAGQPQLLPAGCSRGGRRATARRRHPVEGPHRRRQQKVACTAPGDDRKVTSSTPTATGASGPTTPPTRA